MAEVEESARDYMLSCGQEPPSEFFWNTSKIQRYHVEGDRKGSKNGWYRGYLDDNPVLIFGSFRTGFEGKFRPENTGRSPTKLELFFWKKKADQREVERRTKEEKTAELGQRILELSREADPEHPYLKKKNVKPHGVRQITRAGLGEVAPELKIYGSGDLLIVPLRDVAKILWSLQFITTGGDKIFLVYGRVEGLFFSIGKYEGKIVFCEGFATGATIHEATGHGVAVALNAGNLPKVAKALREKYSGAEFVIAADYDKPAGPRKIRAGEKFGREAAFATGACFAMPPSEGMDLNDLAAAEGLEAVKKIIEAATVVIVDPSMPKKEENEDDTPPEN
jgi:putative DNA primase/helicase